METSPRNVDAVVVGDGFAGLYQPDCFTTFACAPAVNPRLVEALELMENNLEEPLSPDELATYVGVSRRQLERLFNTQLDCSPSRFYLQLRLYRARLLLRWSRLSVAAISGICGFVSAPHFSRCYRQYLGISPRSERCRVGEPASGRR